MTRSVAVGLLSLLLSVFLIRQIVHQLRSGTFRARARMSAGRVKLTHMALGDYRLAGSVSVGRAFLHFS